MQSWPRPLVIDPSRTQVRRLAVGTQADKGSADVQWDGDWMTFAVGEPGVGRYEITWK